MTEASFTLKRTYVICIFKMKPLLFPTLLLTLLFTFTDCRIALANQAAGLSDLIKAYRSIPTEPDEEFTLHLLTNVMLAPLIEKDADAQKALERGNYSKNEKNIRRKQTLMEDIFLRAAVELENQNQLHSLLLDGIDEISNSSQRLSFPNIEKLAGIGGVYKIIQALLQRPEEEVKILALEILVRKGLRYPSTDSFARGLARFAAESAVDSKRYDAILKVFEDLHALLEKHPERPKEKGHGRYWVARISTEIPNAMDNPSLKDPAHKEKVIANTIEQIQTRVPNTSSSASLRVREDLIAGLAAIPGDLRIDQMIANIFENSVTASDIRGALHGVYDRTDAGFYSSIFKLADRIEGGSLSGEQKKELLKLCGQTLLRSVPKESLPQLFQHSNAWIRYSSIKGLNSIPAETRNAQLHKFLSDPDENVRDAALNYVELWTRGNNAEFITKIEEMGKSDPIQGLREWAKELADRMKAKASSSCADELKN